ncbi:MDR family oxidoreductase [Glaciibacter psychrotolerans]|uniref:Acrylyl-CoA reductase (NADPH) n=1 Tax=Glaciibacter psychrotolerans TaxID=670054 RepID=A0A7Z0EG46_9MICO|nr:MDR family oxidoreductase [Leifsonia psychrotolerans]NYJ20910.1 acrylyl-CoA reductase (NADPH) [Leifsonia psychrotolerans]
MTETMQFRAIVVQKTTDAAGTSAQTATLQLVDDDFLGSAAVTIELLYSSINFKDGLALGGRPGVVRAWPLIAGIDLVGTVLHSSDPRWMPGDLVLQNGAKLGESLHGGLAERARVDGEALVRLPSTLSAKRAAAIGTAGFTAMLSVLALERHGVTPESGPVLVTGATGGVGSLAIVLLAARGYRVHALTGRLGEFGDYLRGLGAVDVIDRAELREPGKPLQSERWAAVVDSVGSVTLANAIAHTKYGGIVTACGMAQGIDLPATVMPFILRSVVLAGINSVDAPIALREQAWQRLGTDLDLDLLDRVTRVIPLAEAPDAAARILSGTLHGRTVVDVRA